MCGVTIGLEGVRMELRRWRFCLVLGLLLSTLQLWADVTGSISGYVRDKSGAVLASASVTVVQGATGYTRTVKTDAAGQYSLLALALAVGSVVETVNVQADSLQVQTESTQLGTTIQSNQILAMPLNGRSYLDLLSLQA